ncbi:DUF3560 domain-containing protein, partial [Burkholderia cenocepacia]|uniref:DUF3560 domain-containing protein n=1 Tax=Burkholderia cenocepacia TaxID=95486 RepID=UPI001C893BF1
TILDVNNATNTAGVPPAPPGAKPRAGTRGARRAAQRQEALERVIESDSVANYDAIFDGFAAMGIARAEVLPRVNVFTFDAWIAQGRVVKRGQHGVKIRTVIECTKTDPETGEITPVRKARTTTVFHIIQTTQLGSDATAPEAPAAEDESPAADASVVVDAVGDAEDAEMVAMPPGEQLVAVVPNAYEARVAGRRERMQAGARKARAESVALHSRAHAMADVIPFGQPILVDHYSAGGDRNYRARITKTFEKSFAAAGRADDLARRARAVGTAGVSSDDPDAIRKLEAKLSALEKHQADMKAANRVVRSMKTDTEKVQAIVALGVDRAAAERLLKPDHMGCIGFPAYALTNLAANIRSVRTRIEDLARRRACVNVQVEGNGYIYREDVADNRVHFVFDGKPDDATRAVLHEHHFRWSPNRPGKPWVRQLTAAGLNSAAAVRAFLDARV